MMSMKTSQGLTGRHLSSRVLVEGSGREGSHGNLEGDGDHSTKVKAYLASEVV